MFYEIHKHNDEVDQTNPEDTTRFLRNLFRYSGKEEWKWWKHYFRETGINVRGFLSSPYEERSPFSHMGNIEDGVSSEAVSDDTLIEIVANFDNAGDAGEAHYFFKAIYDDFEEG